MRQYSFVGLAALGAAFTWLNALAVYTPYMEQSFFFDYNIAGVAVPVPVTAQCDTIHLTWSRSAEAIGPNPTAPYYLQIYTSTFIVPFVIEAGSGLSFDWQVPFVPGTLYQICMFDKFGNTGGCQGIYTVIAANSTPVCNNLTFPAHVLDVEGMVQDGPSSQYGWVPQCTDLSILPKNGTPPFILTIAPTLHPPFNISSDTMSAINWTVTLTWASPFFVSLVDSLGNTWANGPMHSGNGKTTHCLDIDTAKSTTAKRALTMIAMVCAGIGGVLLGMFISYLLARRRARKKAATLHRQKPAAPDSTPLPLQPAAGSHYTAVPSGQFTRSSPNSTWYSTLLGRRNEQYHIDPFIAPDEEGYREPPQRSDCTVANPGEPTPPSRHSDPHSQPPLSQREPSQVYVVHHDGGTPPVTVYTAGGTEVVELPPRYPEGRNQTSRRQPAANRMKVGGPNRRR